LLGSDIVYPDVLTIGHTNHPIEQFFGLLAASSVTTVIDVRSSAASRWNRQFEKGALEASCPHAGLDYRWAGKFLGGRPAESSLIVDGIASYEAMARTENFARGISRVKELAAVARPVLMCSERDPLDCHRCLLVSRRLIADGLSVSHIAFDGAVEAHGDAERRLLQSVEKRRGGKKVLMEAADPLDAAYKFQARRIAWRPKDDLDGEAR